MKNLEEYYKNNLKGIEVGDRVFDLAYGYGKVTAIQSSRNYRIIVEFKCEKIRAYMWDGKFHAYYPIPTLFFNKPTYDEDGYPIPQQKEEKKEIDFLKWAKETGIKVELGCRVDVEENIEWWGARIAGVKNCNLSTSFLNKTKGAALNSLIELISGIAIQLSLNRTIIFPSNFALIKEKKTT